jgi:hypothetical protein
MAISAVVAIDKQAAERQMSLGGRRKVRVKAFIEQDFLL